jgi:hypothetical protein
MITDALPGEQVSQKLQRTCKSGMVRKVRGRVEEDHCRLHPEVVMPLASGFYIDALVQLVIDKRETITR